MKKTKTCRIIENVMVKSLLERRVSRDLACVVGLVKVSGNSISSLEDNKGSFLNHGLFEEEPRTSCIARNKGEEEGPESLAGSRPLDHGDILQMEPSFF